MDQFFEKQYQSKLAKEEMGNLRIPVTSKAFKSIVNDLPKQSPVRCVYQLVEFYIFKGESVPILQIFQKIKAEKTLPYSF